MADGIPSAKARLSIHLAMDVALNQILFYSLDDETPSARLRQLGLMTVLVDLEARMTV